MSQTTGLLLMLGVALGIVFGFLLVDYLVERYQWKKYEKTINK